MLQKESKIKCIDNSGANILKCIRVYGKGKKKATLGENILVVIKNFNKKNIKLQKKVKLKKGLKYIGLLVSVSRKIRRNDGTFFTCDNNRTFLITAQSLLVGTRFKGFLTKELTLKKYKKKYQKLLIKTSLIL